MYSEFRLFQLISSILPVGGFTYSQGLEWAIEKKWVDDSISLENWLKSNLNLGITNMELPILIRLFNAFEKKRI